MPRPRKHRRVCGLPTSNSFGPLGAQAGEGSAVIMTVDEFESVRLIDLEGLTQEECAEQMDVSRTTVQGIYDSARKKLALALVEGRMLLIEGGDYSVCDSSGPGCGRRCRGNHGQM